MDSSRRYSVPPELQDLLLEFTVACLINQPADLVDYAVEYFSRLRDSPDRQSFVHKGNEYTNGGEESEESDDDLPIEPPVRGQRRKSVYSEAYNPEEDDDANVKNPIYPKSDEQRQRLQNALKDIFLFKHLDPQQLQEVVDAFFEKKVQAGEVVIRQGDDGDNFYVIDDGEYSIHVRESETCHKTKKVGTYNNAGFFGELALMYNQPRAATIVAETNGILWGMGRNTFKRLVAQSAYKKRSLHEGLLTRVPMLSALEAYERMNLADALVAKTYHTNDTIIKQGDAADGMYFIEDGTVMVTVETPNGQKEINRLSTGGYFGELALLTHKPRAANVIAVSDVKLAFLEVSAFERLLGPCKNIMKRNAKAYESQMAAVLGESNPNELR
ncbi:unnamed protein product [Notodromas monacha]|uniref:cAMP-dependent protein kinase type II regulatory subunit n=1 Tax=Notodromas monacha TaxID=399045 RepID=A0A7R9BFJ2_9CRUS|nr:unnamed protein product [Notodromas monacha]CAG0913256.1 unnamed protein product [Notodromas monacha]